MTLDDKARALYWQTLRTASGLLDAYGASDEVGLNSLAHDMQRAGPPLAGGVAILLANVMAKEPCPDCGGVGGWRAMSTTGEPVDPADQSIPAAARGIILAQQMAQACEANDYAAATDLFVTAYADNRLASPLFNSLIAAVWQIYSREGCSSHDR